MQKNIDNNALIDLIIQLKQQGIKNFDVLKSIEKLPRKFFIDSEIHSKANMNIALPINCGQTISQPLVVAQMTQALELNKNLRVLEIGTGSGYQTAILSMLSRFVYTIERYKTLKENSDMIFKKMELNNVFTKHGDGGLGWQEQAPFERIIVTAAALEIPGKLIDQLDNNGLMVVPVGEENNNQTLFKIKKINNKIFSESIMSVRFVPLIEGKNNQ
tara:strand:+ start:166 stop:813 length:648 start_codon:yes stop_codon:yes gene_type:complete